MQTNLPKEPQPPIRERPLQKSMFLPEQYPPQSFMHPIPQQNPGEFPLYNPMKRSLLQNHTKNPQSPQYQFRTPNNQSFSSNSYQQPSAMQGQYVPVQQRTGNPGNHHQLLQHSNSLTNIKQQSIVLDRGHEGNIEPHKNFSRMDKQPMAQIKTVGKTINLDSGQHQKIITEIVSLIKEKHLPNLVSLVKKQLQDEFHNFKAQFHHFREEFKNHLGKQENINNQLKTGTNRVSGLGNGHDKSPIKNNRQKDELSELQKELFLLQGKLNKFQTITNENFTFFGEQFDKIARSLQEKHKQQQKSSFKISTIKSSLSAVMLEYKQLFSVKKTANEHTKRVGADDEIILSACQYFVDKQGFLMDSQNHYLLDYKGNQIRLQQKHIKILQHHKILHR